MASRPSLSVNLGLAALPEVDSPEIFAAIMPLYSAVRNLGYALDYYTGNNLVTKEEYSEVSNLGQVQLQKTAVMYLETTEAITRGSAVALTLSGGQLKISKAQEGVIKCRALAVDSGELGATIPVCLFGLLNLYAGLTVGSDYYLSPSTPGLITTTPSGQYLGFAVTTAALWFHPSN